MFPLRTVKLRFEQEPPAVVTVIAPLVVPLAICTPIWSCSPVTSLFEPHTRYCATGVPLTVTVDVPRVDPKLWPKMLR